MGFFLFSLVISLVSSLFSSCVGSHVGESYGEASDTATTLNFYLDRAKPSASGLVIRQKPFSQRKSFNFTSSSLSPMIRSMHSLNSVHRVWRTLLSPLRTEYFEGDTNPLVEKAGRIQRIYQSSLFQDDILPGIIVFSQVMKTSFDHILIIQLMRFSSQHRAAPKDVEDSERIGYFFWTWSDSLHSLLWEPRTSVRGLFDEIDMKNPSR